MATTDTSRKLTAREVMDWLKPIYEAYTIYQEHTPNREEPAEPAFRIIDHPWSQETIKNVIKSLKGRKIPESSRSPQHHMQIEHLLRKLTAAEKDKNFEWIVVQTDRTVEGTLGPQNPHRFTVFVQRRPRQDVCINTLLKGREAIKALNNHKSMRELVEKDKLDPCKEATESPAGYCEVDLDTDSDLASEWGSGRSDVSHSLATSISSRPQLQFEHLEGRRLGEISTISHHKGWLPQHKAMELLKDGRGSQRFSSTSPSEASSEYNSLELRGLSGLDPHRPAGAWTPSDDETLLAARARGMNWAPIQQDYFPTKSPNACRKRHERLMERRNADDWDSLKLERLASSYMSMRKEIWSLLGDHNGEKWNVVEAKCMSQGIRNLQTAARAAARRPSFKEQLETSAAQPPLGPDFPPNYESTSDGNLGPSPPHQPAENFSHNKLGDEPVKSLLSPENGDVHSSFSPQVEVTSPESCSDSKHQPKWVLNVGLLEISVSTSESMAFSQILSDIMPRTQRLMKKHLNCTVKQSFNSIGKRLTRQKVPDGYRRLEWTCECGDDLYADFNNSDPRWVDELEAELRSVKSKMAMSQDEDENGEPGEAKMSNSLDQPLQHKERSDSTGSSMSTASTMRFSRDITEREDRDEDIERNLSPSASNHSGRIENVEYLEVCLEVGRYQTRHTEVNVTGLTNDAEFFGRMKKEYQGLRRRSSIFLTPKDVRFVEFSVQNMGDLVGILDGFSERSPSLPPESLVKEGTYAYEPCPLRPKGPPVPSNIVLHELNSNKSLLHTSTTWSARVPKKKNTTIYSNPDTNEANFGWGVHIIEGWNMYILIPCIAALTLFGCLACVVGTLCWLLIKHDANGAFSLGAEIAGILALVLCMVMIFLQWSVRNSG